MYRQLSFFTAGHQPAVIDDLDGLLAASAQLVRRGGAVRLSVILDHRWRADALAAELAQRSLTTQVSHHDGGLLLCTDFDTVISPVAQRWTRGASVCPPDDIALDGPRLRLWTLAAGRADRFGFCLPAPACDDRAWPLLGGALSRAGVSAALLGPRAGGPAFRITGARRLSRLRELVGDPPVDAGMNWPRPDAYPGRG